MEKHRKRLTLIEQETTLKLSPLEIGLLKFIRDSIDPDFTPEREGQCYSVWVKIATSEPEIYKKWIDAGNECPFKPYRGDNRGDNRRGHYS